MWVGRPCPPVCNNIVTPHHLFQFFCNIGFAIFKKEKKGVCYEKERIVFADYILITYSMIVFVCNISWRCNSKSYQDNWIPKKVPERWWNYILWCVTPRIFLEKLKPSDMWRSIKQNFIGKPIYCNIINFFLKEMVPSIHSLKPHQIIFHLRPTLHL